MVSENIPMRDIYTAMNRILPFTRKTDLVYSSHLPQITKRSAYLKVECFQETGSFKVRGAANKLLTLSAEEKHCGVIAFSTGNHGRAVAHIAKQLGIKAVICLSERVPQYRVETMKQLGQRLFNTVRARTRPSSTPWISRKNEDLP